MDKELTLKDIYELINKNQNHTDRKLTSLTEMMMKQFDKVEERFNKIETRLDKLEFNKNNPEQRISTLEEQMRIVGIKLGLTS